MFASTVLSASMTGASVAANKTDLNSNQVSNESNANITDIAFDDILSQLNALGTEIDQELSSHKELKSVDSSTVNSNSTKTTNSMNTTSNNTLKSDTEQSTPNPESNFEPFSSPYHYHSETMLRSVPNQANHFYQSAQSTTSTSSVPSADSKSQLASHFHFPSHQPSSPSFHYHHYSGSGQSLDSGQNDTNLEMSNQLRTDSPDNDSAFSDTISLISSEQSSSSSSSATANVNITDKSRTSPSSQAAPNEPNSLVSCSSSVINVEQNSKPPSSLVELPQQQLFFESKNGDSNQKDDSSQSIVEPNVDDSQFNDSTVTTTTTTTVFSPIDKPKFNSINMILNEIDWSFLSRQANCLVKENDISTKGGSVGGAHIVGHVDHEFEQKIRVALDKIREANIRKLYLKVFAEDNSAKSLLADERMTIGAICRHLAQKNHISMETSHCIIEHMPQLYLERYYEDHESLVENVLYWGRDSGNKLYFMSREDKYEMFVHPEKYLISSQPNESADTLKSGSLRAKYNANQLRADLISQFFANGAAKVPEIEGNLYLRSEKKKVWKKYFFTLRTSGLYYSPKGKPKSTKDLICLTTFEMNCVYYGFGWKKKFKSPSDYGFAIKHPQIQCKSPKQIKYLCAENEDELRLWMTGIRIAKYGRQLYDNYKQFNLADSTDSVSDDNRTSKPILTFQSVSALQDNNGNNANVNNGNYHFYQYEDHYGHMSHSSVVMRQNLISRNDSVRSSSASSSSGCVSEQSSVASNPSPGNNGNVQSPVHEFVSSPHHLPHPHNMQQASPLNAFDADFPLGTIKRKPSVMLQPKIPLTNTTRNLALQSDDALLEMNDCNESACGGAEDESIVGSPNHCASTMDFQRGTFKTGTLRRSTTDERMKHNKIYDMTVPKLISPAASPAHNYNHQIYSPPQMSTKNSVEHICNSDEDLPPPPPPGTLKETQSTLSLNSFPPPPSPEVLNSTPPVSNNCPTVITNGNGPASTRNLQKQQQSMSSLQSIQQLSPLPLPTLSTSQMPMSPQPQPKNSNRLLRRLSDLSSNSSLFINFRNNYDTFQNVMAPNSRASIAASETSASTLPNGFVTMKCNGSLSKGSGNRFQRQMTMDLHSLNKYGTSPRIRYDSDVNTNSNVNYGDLANFYNHQHSLSNINNNSVGVYGTYNGSHQMANSHCSLVSDNTDSGLPNGRSHSTPQHYVPQHSQVYSSHPSSPLHNGNQGNNRDNSSAYGHFCMPNVNPPMAPNTVPSSPHHMASHQPPKENHYMSISPHLLQKHQQMQRQQQQSNNYHSQNNGPIYSSSPSNSNYNVPADLFLKNMERVMNKKWNVAQMLNQDHTVTPGQVLGFRDSAYLPPKSDDIRHQYGNNGQLISNNYMPPPPPPPSHFYQTQPASFTGSHTNMNHYNGTGYQQQTVPPSVYQRANQSHTSIYHTGKTVRISDADPVIISSQTQQYSTGSLGSGGRKIPPPPPKRSETTQLTSASTATVASRVK